MRASLQPRSWLVPRLKGLALFLAVVGPGVITSNVDNDAGGIATYSICGARFGYSLIWSLIPISILLVVVQEMSVRLGVVTGKGLSDLIRERFGVKVAFYLMTAVLLVNVGNTVAEFAGVAAALGLVGVSKYIAVPVAAILVWLLVVKGDYKRVEKVFILACAVYASYIAAGVIVKPDWARIGREVLAPSWSWGGEYLAMFVGLVGTTIAPWMQFYLQAAVVEKGIKATEYRLARWDVILGAVVVSVVALFIIIACGATLHPRGILVEDAAEAALALRPLAGDYAAWLFGFGLLNASLFAASILPLSTAYSVAEAFGWEAGVDKKFAEAPQFYFLYTVMIGVGAGGVLLPGVPLFKIIYVSQIINGVALPAVIIAMLILINDRRLMGQYVNGFVANVFTGACAFAVAGLAVAMLFLSV